jgi:hypothetical protein
VADRSAVSTIVGYFYQFDHSILSILNLATATDQVDIECIEDIDVHTADQSTAIQCKYYEKTEYNHSVIKPAVMYMLVHYVEGQATGRPQINYELRGYFASGQDKLTDGFDLEFLKRNFLTYTSKGLEAKKHDELKVSDETLNDFLSVLRIDVRAQKYEDQFDSIVGALQRHFDCSRFSAEYFYYNNALRIIKELATKSLPVERRVSKADFLQKIDTSKILFDEWFVARKGKAKYLSDLRLEYFSEINVSPASRLFIIHVGPERYKQGELKDLAKFISRKYSKISKRTPKPFSPFVAFVGVEEAELRDLKQELHNEGFEFCDGYDFRFAKFDPFSISRPATFPYGPNLRIFDNLDNAKETFDLVRGAREIFEFYITSPVEVFAGEAIRNVRIQVTDHEDIRKII